MNDLEQKIEITAKYLALLVASTIEVQYGDKHTVKDVYNLSNRFNEIIRRFFIEENKDAGQFKTN